MIKTVINKTRTTDMITALPKIEEVNNPPVPMNPMNSEPEEDHVSEDFDLGVKLDDPDLAPAHTEPAAEKQSGTNNNQVIKKTIDDEDLDEIDKLSDEPQGKNEGPFNQPRVIFESSKNA